MKFVRLQKINFKKVFIIYLIAALVAGIASVAVLGLTFRNQISLAMQYRKINETCDNGASAVEQKEKLTAFANSSQDVVDVLILDGENKVVFSAKNAGLANDGTLNLEPRRQEDSRWGGFHEGTRGFLVDPSNPDIYYRVLGSEFLRSPEALLADRSERGNFEEGYFYEIGAKTVYSLRYMMNEKSGEKVYFVFDFKWTANSEYVLKGVAALVMLFFMLYWVLTALAVYADASKSKLRGAAWGLLTLFTNLAGVLIYLIYKQINQTCYQCHAVQSRDNTYCTFCGVKLAGACPKCDGHIEKSDDYCAHCGEKISK